MRDKDEGHDWIDGRLVRWANWHLRDLERSDFPTTTALYWIMRQKRTNQTKAARTAVAKEMVKQFGSRVLCRDMSGEVWDTHLAVLRTTFKNQTVLTLRYMLIQDRRGALLTDAGRGKMLGISKEAFRMRVKRAKAAVALEIDELKRERVTHLTS